MTKITGSSWGKPLVRGEDFACVRVLFPQVFPPLTGLFFYRIPVTLYLIDIDMVTDFLVDSVWHSINYNYAIKKVKKVFRGFCS